MTTTSGSDWRTRRERTIAVAVHELHSGRRSDCQVGLAVVVEVGDGAKNVAGGGDSFRGLKRAVAAESSPD